MRNKTKYLQPNPKPLSQGTHVGHVLRQLVQGGLVRRAGVVEIQHATEQQRRRLVGRPAGRAAAERQSLEVRHRKNPGRLRLFYSINDIFVCL